MSDDKVVPIRHGSKAYRRQIREEADLPPEAKGYVSAGDVLPDAARQRREDDELLASLEGDSRHQQRDSVAAELRWLLEALREPIEREAAKCKCTGGYCGCEKLNSFQLAEHYARLGIESSLRGDYEDAAYCVSRALHGFAFPYVKWGTESPKVASGNRWKGRTNADVYRNEITLARNKMALGATRDEILDAVIAAQRVKPRKEQLQRGKMERILRENNALPRARRRPKKNP